MKIKKIVESHWTDLGKLPNEKMNTWKCKWCKHQRKHHSTRMLEHLANGCLQCPQNVSKYCQSRLADKQKSQTNSRRKRKHSEIDQDSDDDSDDDGQSSTTRSNLSHSSQQSEPLATDRKTSTLIGFCDKMSLQDQLKAEYLLALAIFASGSPLSLTENSFWISLFRFLRPKFECPSRHIMSNILLEQVYHAVKNEIDLCIRNAKTVNLHVTVGLT